MNFFKNQSEAARATLAAMPMQSRVIVGLLLATIGIGLAFLVRGEIETSHVPLFNGRSLSETERISMELAFSNAGLSDWKAEGTRLMIPSANKAEYYAALASSTTLPMSLRSYVDEAMEKANVFDSTDMRRSREKYAREKDLAAQVMSAPDIRHASVVHDRGQRTGLGRSAIQSASVVVQPIGTEPLSRRRIRVIQEMIRAAYSGMTADDVVVTDLNGNSTSMMEEDDPVLRKQRETEILVEQKVRNLLIGYPARIAVSAEIDPAMNVQTTSIAYDSEPTTLASDSMKSESVTSTIENRGEPGVRPNVTANRATSLADSTETRRVEEDKRQTRAVTGETWENKQSASLLVKSIQVSVGLPESFYEKMLVREALKANPDASPEDIDTSDAVALERIRTATEKSIQTAVAPLLPAVAAGTDLANLVKVWPYPDPVEQPIEQAASSEAIMTWLSQSWQSIALIGLALVALLVARGAAKNAAPIPPEFSEAFGLELPKPPEISETAASETEMDITGGTLQSELTQIVETNPEVAANIIRGWIGEAA